MNSSRHSTRFAITTFVLIGISAITFAAASGRRSNFADSVREFLGIEKTRATPSLDEQETATPQPTPKRLVVSAADQFFACDGTTLSGSKWAATSSGPFTDPFSAGNNANFAKVNGTGTGGSISVAAINAIENFTLTSPSGTITNLSNGVIPITVASSKTLDFGTQAFTSSATAGYNFTGPGTLALNGGTYQGGFTINSGTLVARGVNAMGGGAANTLTINGGTIAGATTLNFLNKYGGGITFGGNFKIGELTTNVAVSLSSADLTFNNNINLGPATRTVTIGGTGVYTFGGVISGASGAGLTIANAPGAGGIINLSGPNTYTGNTTIAGGAMALVGTGSIANSAVIDIGGGGLFDITTSSSSVTLASGQALQASGTTSTGTIALNSTKSLTTSPTSPLRFTAFNGTTPPLTLSGAGTLTLQTGNLVTVTIANGGVPLPVAQYKLIAKGSTGTVAGTPTSLVVNGDGVAGIPSLVNIGGELFLRVTAATSGAIDFTGANFSVDESGPTGTLTLQRTGGTSGAVSVVASITGGTATGGTACALGSGVDYINTTFPVMVNFADGATSGSVNIPICNDSLWEPGGPESVNVSLSLPSGGATIGLQSTASLNVIDNDAQPVVQFTNSTFSFSENTGVAQITLQRNNAAENAVSVNYNMSSGTATGGPCGSFNGNDFEVGSGIVNFAAGETSKSFQVQICDDNLFENQESFPVAINTPVGAALGTPNEATVFIDENDTAPTVDFSTSTSTVGEDEGTVMFTVNRTGATENAFTVNFATADGTALNGPCNTGDYNSNAGTLNFAGGDPDKTFNVTVCDDAEFESNETFSVTLSSPSNVAVVGSTPTETITITDNDPAPATLVVTNTTDNDGVCLPGNCSLRQAINSADSSPDVSTITFNIPGSGVQTISLLGALPPVIRPTIIDGYTQPGASANTLPTGSDAVVLIEIDGTSAGSPFVDGITTAAQLTISGLAINSFSGNAITIVGGTGTVIFGNRLGTDASGTTFKGNLLSDVFISSSNGNIVGGSTPASRNILVSNGFAVEIASATGNTISNNYVGLNAAGDTSIPSGGILLLSADNNQVGGVTAGERNVIVAGGNAIAVSSANNNVVEGNYIGTDATGTNGLLVLGSGVELLGSSSGNTIGGTAPGAGNVIGSCGLPTSQEAGIRFLGDTVNSFFPSNNTVTGNLIGTNAAGTAALANARGIDITNGFNNTIGGLTAPAANLISGNTLDAVRIQGPNSTGNAVKGNRIGVANDGLTALHNGSNGILITSAAANNAIGGTAGGSGNIIAFGNGGAGVRVDEAGGAGNSVVGNSIFSNAGGGIDLGTAGPTANDGLDGDIGANDLQNFPVITNITGPNSAATISGTLNSNAGQAFAIDVYASAACDPSGFGQGKTYLGRQSSGFTDGSGNTTFIFGPAAIPAGQPFITATATNAAGSTSEFSACVAVTVPTAPEIDVTGLGVSIADGDTTPSAADDTDLGNVNVNGGTVSHTFTISNSGTADLNLNGTPKVSVLGMNASLFTVTTQPVSPVAASGSTTFTISFDPTANGVRSATVSIANDDPDENPYDFTVQGTGVTPDYEITTTGGTMVVNDLSGNGDPLGITQPASGQISFGVLGRTFSINGAPLTSGNSGSIPLAGLNSITINGNTGDDGFFFGAFVTPLPSLTINGGTGNDNVQFSGPITFFGNANLNIDMQNDDPAPGSDRVDLVTGAQLHFQVNGGATIKVSQAVTFMPGTSIQVSNGDLDIEVNQQISPTAGTSPGVFLNGGTLTTTGTGKISMLSKGQDGAGGGHSGLAIVGGATISSTAPADGGAIILNGTGGAGTSNNTGVDIEDAGTLISSVTGDITITGHGGQGTTLRNYGVAIATGSAITSGGPAKISINGTGGGGTRALTGVRITDEDTTVTSSGGNISIIGHAGDGSGDSLIGVLMISGSTISATNGAAISIDGTAGNGSGDQVGVEVSGSGPVNLVPTTITSDSGDISITGNGGISPDGSDIGINFDTGAAVKGSGASNVTLNGTGGSGANDCYGVGFDSGSATGTGISSENGNILIIGVGGSTPGTDMDGVRFEDSTGSEAASLSVTGTGFGTINGSAGNADATSSGINFVDDTNVSVAGPFTTFIADSMDIGTSNVQIDVGTNTITLVQKTPGRNITVGVTDSATELGLTDAELDAIKAGNLFIGDTTSGAVVLLADITRSQPTAITIVSGANIDINGGLIDSGGGNVDLEPGTNVFPFKSGVDVSAGSGTLSLPSGRSLRLIFTGTTPDSQYTQLNVAGAVDINGATLDLESSSFTPAAGQSFVIVNNDGADPISGTFAALPEGSAIPNFLGSGLDATISYTGGDGNDVVLTVQSAADTTPPDTTIDSGPPNLSNSSSASFTFSGTDNVGGSGVSRFECSLDGATFATCTSPQDYTGITDGSHTFEVRAVDAANNADPTPASRTWTVDTTPPVIDTYTPLGNTTSTDPRPFDVIVTDNTAVGGVTLFYSVNGGAPGTIICVPDGPVNQWLCSTPGVSSGSAVSYNVEATDTAGNTSDNPAATAPNLFTVGAATVPAGTYSNMSLFGGSTLGGDSVVLGTFDLGGVVTTGTDILELGCAANVTGAGASSYVNGNVRKDICGTGSFSFPVGENGFTPVSVDVTALGVNPSALTVRSIDAPLVGFNPLQSLSRNWQIDETGDVTATLSFTYLPEDVVGDESNYRVWRVESNGTATNLCPSGPCVAPPVLGPVSGVTQFSRWTGSGPASPTAAPASISGQVRTQNGTGLRNAYVTVSGGNLSQPIVVATSSFGYYRVNGLTSGEAYVISVSARRYTFASPVRALQLFEDISGYDFIADQ